MRGLTALVAIVAALWLIGTAKAETNYQKAKRIIFAVFPDSTQEKALRVAGCETGGTYKAWAKNRSSGAMGLFQFIPSNHNRLIHWGRYAMKIDYYRMWNPWYASKAALILSSGGTNWGEWDCG